MNTFTGNISTSIYLPFPFPVFSLPHVGASCILCHETEPLKTDKEKSSNMSCCSFNFQSPKALPTLSPQCRRTSLFVAAKYKPFHNTKFDKKLSSINRKLEDHSELKKFSLAVQFAALLATIEQPAFALTGVNNPEDLTWILIQFAIVTFWYFIMMPPIIFNWFRLRQYRRKLLETYLQFMCIFIFFPGIMLWAPFLNFRKFPRDPSLKYPWSKPEDPSKIKNDYLRYPWATPEDYD